MTSHPHLPADGTPPVSPPIPPPIGMMSPDGRYQWNGYQWFPVWGGAPGGARNRRHGWKIAGGCCSGALVVAVILVFVAVHLFQNAPLRSFPVYPGATPASASIHFNSVRNTQSIIWHTPATVTQVKQFYAAHLDGTEWTLTGTADRTWTFSHVGSPPGAGTLTLTSSGLTTVIDVEFAY